ncbi:MAG: adenine phosphoribosyltransferase [Thermodesulfobacteriota bacterium]
MTDIQKFIRNIPDFPKKGIVFHDITPLLQNAKAFQKSIDMMAEILSDKNITSLVGIESRGFIFASALSIKLDTGLVVIRKPGKLPYVTINASYDLEYGKDTLEIHKDAINKESNVVIVDDLLATGGTAGAAGKLIEQLGGKISGYIFLIELTELKGAEKLKPHNVYSVLKFPV